jgi:hypothetical protein
VGWWPGDGNGRDLVSTNDGVLFGGVSFVPGLVGQAFRFDGINDHVTVPASPNLAVQSLTIELWIQPTDARQARPLVEYAAATGVAGVHFWYATQGWLSAVPGAIYANLRDPTSADPTYLSSPGSLVPINAWSHVVLTFDKPTSMAKLYVNGAVVAVADLSASTFNPATALPVNFGYRPVGSGDLLNGRRYVGLMDEISIYNRALTPTELAVIHAAGLNSMGKCSIASCLPNAVVTVQDKPRTVVGTSSWQTNSFLFSAIATNTFVELSGKPLSLLFDTFELTPVRAPAYYLPE